MTCKSLGTNRKRISKFHNLMCRYGISTLTKRSLFHVCVFFYFFYSFCSFVRSFVCSFIRSFIYSFVRSLVRSFAHSIVRLFVHSFNHSFIPSLIHEIILDIICSFLVKKIRCTYVDRIIPPPPPNSLFCQLMLNAFTYPFCLKILPPELGYTYCQVFFFFCFVLFLVGGIL